MEGFQMKLIPGYVRVMAILVFIMITFQVDVYGQDEESLGTNTQVAIGFSIGTKGIPAIDLAVKPFENVNFRFGFNWMNFRFNEFQSNLNRFPNDISFAGGVNMSSFEVLVERGFLNNQLRLVSGLGFFYSNQFDLRVQLADDTKINDIDLSPEEIGYGQGLVKWNSLISPYIGVGYGKAIAQNKWSFSIDAGVYFKNSPSFKMEATNLVRSNVRNEDLIEEKLAFFKWMPVITFRLSRRIFLKNELAP